MISSPSRRQSRSHSHSQPHSIRAHSALSSSTSSRTHVPLAVSTRSMAKLASSKPTSTPTPSASTGKSAPLARSGTLRRPLAEMATNVNAERRNGVDNGKRKGKEQDGPPNKVVRYGYGGREPATNVAVMPTPATPRKASSTPQETQSGNVFIFKTPEKTSTVVAAATARGTRPEQPFTPARELLRRGVPQGDDDDDDGAGDAHRGEIVVRAPTPPRAHIDADEAMASPKRSRSPDIDMATPNKRPTMASPSPRKMWEHIKPKSPAISETALKPPATPGTSISPRRVFAGLSRLKAPLSPYPTVPLLTDGTSGSVVASEFTLKIDPPEHRSLSEIQIASIDSTMNHASLEEPSHTSVPTSAAESSSTQNATRHTSQVPSLREPAVQTARHDARPQLARGDGSMGPPSRIPTITKAKPLVAAVAPSSSKSTLSSWSEGTSNRTVAAKSKTAALPERRPTSRPLTAAPPASSSGLSKDGAAAPADAPQPIRRKPSYPASLGSGPLARPTSRMVSNPVLPPRNLSSDTPVATNPVPPAGPIQSPRSVSAPVPTNRLGLSSSVSRRELSLQTNQTMTGLSAALEKLKVKKDSVSEPSRPRPPTTLRASLSASTTGPPDTQATSILSMSTSSRLSSVHRPRMSVLPSNADMSIMNEEHVGDRSIAALMCSSSGEGCLKGVVAFVDVFTSEGADSSAVFADMLRSLGARVLSRLTENVTHVVYKSGRPTTLAWWRKQDPRPHIVGISWVTKSKECGERQEEAKFCVEVGDEDIFQKRRKSMEPRALMNSVGPGAARPSVLLDISLAQARRKSMMYAPKISSPLKRAPVRKGDENDGGEADYFGRL